MEQKLFGLSRIVLSFSLKGRTDPHLRVAGRFLGSRGPCTRRIGASLLLEFRAESVAIGVEWIE